MRSQQAEREKWKENEREKDLQYETRRNGMMLSQQKEIYALQEKSRKTLLLQDNRAYQEKLKMEQVREKDMNGYRDKEHERRTKELTMERAMQMGLHMPVCGVPARRPVGAPPGQRFLTMDSVRLWNVYTGLEYFCLATRADHTLTSSASFYRLGANFDLLLNLSPYT